MNDDQTPQLSVQQAADFLCGCVTRDYRSLCLAYFRQRYGDNYADQVKAEVCLRFESRRRR